MESTLAPGLLVFLLLFLHVAIVGDHASGEDCELRVNQLNPTTLVEPNN